MHTSLKLTNNICILPQKKRAPLIDTLFYL